MIGCITRNDMKFGDYYIPARTKATVINKPRYRQANIPGLQLKIAVSLWDMVSYEDKKKGIPESKTQINNELADKRFFGNTDSQMIGITVITNGTQVYLDASDRFYEDTTLTGWQVQRLLGEVIPENIKTAPFSKEYLLGDVVEYLDNEFAEWVQNNCEFRKLTKRDIENGDGFDGAEPGDTMLSEKGVEQFYTKQLEYKNLLEKTGFTYEFKGGLIWD